MEKSFRITLFESKTLTWWRTRRTKIDMDPAYQRRGRLWSPADKVYLIDSILNGYDIPKIYMADFTWGDSKLNTRKLPYAIIDGKQRFEAIFDFFDNKITLSDDFVYLPNPGLAVAGLGYRDLQQNYPEISEEFDNYNLFVMSVSAQDEKTISELFIRLNRSKPLTGAEVRNAMVGPAPELIRQIAKHEFFTTYISFSVKRGTDLNAAAKFLFFEYARSVQATKKINLDEFAEKTGIGDGQLELAGRRTLDLLDRLTEIFLPDDKLLASSGLLPVYYWFIRSQNQNMYYRVREFLVQFEAARQSNRRLISAHPDSNSIDSELTQYDNYNRSTNDQSSHDGRIRILQERFSLFISNK